MADGHLREPITHEKRSLRKLERKPEVSSGACDRKGRSWSMKFVRSKSRPKPLAHIEQI
jgi:hypothetical protein